MINEGASQYHVQQLLGHKDSRMTQRYMRAQRETRGSGRAARRAASGRCRSPGSRMREQGPSQISAKCSIRTPSERSIPPEAGFHAPD
ncbi:hypothetical protein [Paraburkholderia azotifigens]|uniref:Tyrosine-type recombinase/integrase n=2 Tax=Paraburkholderia azotifigens TaxID=2057004 RepID=A0ABU9R0E1_9BURK